MPAPRMIPWKCPNCGFKWQNTGEGLDGYKFDKCRQCGKDVAEPDDVDQEASRRMPPQP